MNIELRWVDYSLQFRTAEGEWQTVPRVTTEQASIEQTNNAQNVRLRRIAWLIGSIFCFGGFKAETVNERELEKLLRENGTFWETPSQFDAALKDEDSGFTSIDLVNAMFRDGTGS